MDLTKFVVGPPTASTVIEFEPVMIEGSPNVIVKPNHSLLLNRHGLRRLAAHLNSLADLIDSGQAHTE